MINSTKICSSCKEKKLLTEFNKKKENYYQPYCRVCDNAKSRARYKVNGESHRASVLLRNRIYRKELQTWIKSLKSNQPCLDCNTIYPWFVMDYDHVLPGKVKPVSEMVGALWAKDKIIEEIAKCELICANCHRIRTFTRSGHFTEDLLE